MNDRAKANSGKPASRTEHCCRRAHHDLANNRINTHRQDAEVHSHSDVKHDHDVPKESHVHKHNSHCHDSHAHDQLQEVRTHHHDGHDHAECSHEHTPSGSQSFTSLQNSQVVPDGVCTEIRIMQMDCPVEENLIQKKLNGMSSVKKLDFNLIQRVLTVTHEPDSLDNILDALKSLGFKPEVSVKEAASFPVQEKKKPWWPLALASATAVAAEMMNWAGMPVWLEAGLAIIAVISCGLGTYKKGWISIRNGNLNINALMSIAVTGATHPLFCAFLRQSGCIFNN